MSLRSTKRKNRFRKRKSVKRGGGPKSRSKSRSRSAPALAPAQAQALAPALAPAQAQAQAPAVCAICLDDSTDPTNTTTSIVGCNHSFHKKCLDEWYKIKRTCPNCRRNIKKKGNIYERTNETVVTPLDPRTLMYLQGAQYEVDQARLEYLRQRENSGYVRYFERIVIIVVIILGAIGLGHMLNNTQIRNNSLNPYSRNPFSRNPFRGNRNPFRGGLTTEEDLSSADLITDEDLLTPENLDNALKNVDPKLLDLTIENLFNMEEMQTKCNIKSMIANVKTEEDYEKYSQITVRDVIELFKKTATDEDKALLVEEVNTLLEQCQPNASQISSKGSSPTPRSKSPGSQASRSKTSRSPASRSKTPRSAASRSISSLSIPGQ